MGVQRYKWVYKGMHGYKGVNRGIQDCTWVYKSIQ